MGVTAVAAIGAAATTPVVLLIVDRNSRKPHQTATGTKVLVATALAVAGALLASRHSGVMLAAAAVPLVLGVAVALIDIRELRIPNRLAVLMLAAGLVTVVVVAGASDDPLVSVGRALAAGAIAATMMLLAKLLRPSALGWGDVKLAPGLGCYLGLPGDWQVVYLGLLLWWLLIAVSSVLALVVGLLRRDDPMPYAPAMVAGTLIAVLLS